MRTRTTHDLPAPLARTRSRFEQWRANRTGLSRIPEALWASAVKAAGKHGVCQTARVLGLDYSLLKKRVAAAASSGVGDREAVARFIELSPPPPVGSRECILELENHRGAKMRVYFKGLETSDLAALTRSLWSIEA